MNAASPYAVYYFAIRLIPSRSIQTWYHKTTLTKHHFSNTHPITYYQESTSTNLSFCSFYLIELARRLHHCLTIIMGSLASSQPSGLSNHPSNMNGFDHPHQIRELADAQEQFAQHAESLEHPEVAMSEYARYIHEHTKAQLARAASTTHNGSTMSSLLSATSSREEIISSNGS